MKDEQDSETPGNVTRRKFVTQAVAATSAVALASVLPPSVRAQSECSAAETLRRIGEIKSDKGTGILKGVIRIKNARKALPGYTGSQLPMMRYFDSTDQQAGTVWPPAADKDKCLPGPTLRVAVGEKVQITFLNQVDVGTFPGLTLDNAETGATEGCDPATNATVDPPDKKWYPDTRGDSYPNCFHASSSANLHFHGTHITPDGFGDNVLVQVRPNPKLDEKEVERLLQPIFQTCGENPPAWKDVYKPYQGAQAVWVKEYDLTAIWKGTRGPVNGQPALPHANQLTPANDSAIAQGQWPPFFVGAYPTCFKITEAAGHKMGQAPGTHWYHAHKHGSTAINLFNGLAGALIIEGDYDRDLAKIYPNLKKCEKVLVVQQFTDLPNLERVSRAPRVKTTNGGQVVAASSTAAQVAPAIVMRPGEIQLWRIVNAQVQPTITGKFTGPKASVVSPLPKFRQIAQDGVQFSLTNYKDQPLTTKDGDGNGTQFSLAAGGRIDILVQAPLLPSGTSSASYELAGVVNLTVTGTPMADEFPTDANYPVFPPFLKDIKPPARTRDLSFDWEPYRISTGAASTTVGQTHSKQVPFDVEVGNDRIGKKTIKINQNRGPYFMIDEEQFSDHKYYQTMVLDDEEEWTIINTTSLAHPFHIHVNPFQIIQVSDPNNAANSYTREQFGVWQDVINIPAAKTDANGKVVIGADGKATTPGFVRIRSKFVDFTGSYVLHCHILAHEDRGMMQLVRVIDKKTTIQHH
jgi:FtsP/CotA-like multicopper oxidase with cupredoxin domain